MSEIQNEISRILQIYVVRDDDKDDGYEGPNFIVPMCVLGLIIGPFILYVLYGCCGTCCYKISVMYNDTWEYIQTVKPVEPVSPEVETMDRAITLDMV